MRQLQIQNHRERKIMANPQRRSRSSTQRSPRRGVEFVAAVRFKDGARQLFSVSNATDSEEARKMVFEELVNVASVVVAER